MAVNDPTWSYGESVLINSSDTTTDPDWSYGASWLIFEYVPTASLSGTVINSITESDIVNGGKTIILTLTGDTFIKENQP